MTPYDLGAQSKADVFKMLLIFFRKKKKYGVSFEYVPWKTAWFCFISITWVHLSHKTKKF